MGNRPYTKEEIENIKQWRARGCTMQEIAERLNRNIGSICSACNRFGIPYRRDIRSKKKWNEEKISVLCSHYERGDSRKELAEEFGVTENTISVILSHARRIGLMKSYRNIGRPRINSVNN